jgi:hypothetical protein
VVAGISAARRTRWNGVAVLSFVESFRVVLEIFQDGLIGVMKKLVGGKSRIPVSLGTKLTHDYWSDF